MSTKSIISCFLLIAIFVFIFPFPAHADGLLDVVSFWDYVFEHDHLHTFLDQFLDPEYYSSSPGCSNSTDGLHHWIFENAGPLTPGVGYYYCSFCHMSRDDYMADAYDDYVDSLPSNVIDSDGGLFWYPDYDFRLYAYVQNSSGGSAAPAYYLYSALPVSGSQSGVSFVISKGESCVVFDVTYRGSARKTVRLTGTFYAPVSGSYKLYRSDSGLVSTKSYSSGASISYDQQYIIDFGSGASTGTLKSKSIYLPYYVVTPSSSYDPSETFSDDTRVANFTLCLGSFYNGDLTNVYNDVTIINEGSNTYYNPVTNVTYDLSRWSYDYGTRTYNVTTTDDDTFSITFGDLSLTLDEGGGDVYELNYIVEHAPPAPCNHVYAVSDHQDPTCTLNGYTEYTCSVCGSSYREMIFALGHEWSFVESVEAEYDENDELVADAYDLYRCIRCGREKHEAPGTHDDSHDYSGFFSWLQNWLMDFKSWLGDKLDALLGKDTEINVDIDNHTVTVVNEDGEEEEVDVPDIISRFGWFRDAWAIGTYFIETVGENEQAAYNYAESTRGGTKSGEVSTGAPSIKINLSAAQSHYGFDYGGEVEALDLSWYTPYKRTVDNLLSGFLWLVFLWNVFRHAPGIISGSGLTANHLDDLEQGHKERRRSK